MTNDKRKVALIGTGMVGMSYAYALVNQNICDELVLIDIDKDRARGEAMDLNDGMAFASSHIYITDGDYKDCSDADIAVITAGANQLPEEKRMDLLHKNSKIVRSIVSEMIKSGFNGIFLVASNPVDVMTMVVKEESGFPKERVFGSGTTLDTARLRYKIGEFFNVDSRNVHAYVIGEHGDSEFVPWSQAMVSTMPVTEMKRNGKDVSLSDLQEIGISVRDAAYVIIKAKRATYYGIGMSLVRITKAIFGDEHSVLTLSAQLNGEYDEKDVCVGVPCIIGRDGVREILQLKLTRSEKDQLHDSCEILRNSFKELKNDK